METIKFHMHPTRSDFSKAASAKLTVSRSFRAYLVAMALILVLCILWRNYGPDAGSSLAKGLGFLVFLGLISPFVISYSMSARAFKRGSPRVEECTFEVGKEGLGWKSACVNVSFTWTQVSAIYETKDFLFVRLRKGHLFPIFKNRVLDASVEEIRKVLLNAPVQNKKMIANGNK